MNLTIIIGIWTSILFVRLILGTKQKLMSFGDSKLALRTEFDSYQLIDIPKLSVILIFLLFLFCAIYYVLSNSVVNDIWFSCFSILKILTLLFDYKLALHRYIDRDNVSNWKPTFQDSFQYKLINHVILEYVYLLIVLFNVAQQLGFI